MIVDTSAVIAILRGERTAEQLADALLCVGDDFAKTDLRSALG